MMIPLIRSIETLKVAENTLNQCWPLLEYDDHEDLKLLINFAKLFYMALQLSMIVETQFGRHINN